MEDHQIIEHIDRLVDEEHDLERRVRVGVGITDADHTRLRELEVRLDQLWDLLRQRRARRAAGQDPEVVAERDPSVVERYQQ